MKKKEKKKDTKFHKTYGLASNLSYIVKEMWKYDKITLVVVGFYGFFTPIAAYLWTFMSKFVIDIVTRKDDVKKLIGIIFITFIIQLVCTLCQSWSWGQWWRPISVRLSMLIQKNIKFMKLPYEYLEDKDTMDCYEKAVRTTDGNKKGVEGMIHLLENGAADIFTVIVGLFIIGTLSAPIMLVMAVLAFISFLIKDHTNRVVKERIWDAEKSFFAVGGVRELNGYAPWYFGMELPKAFSRAWEQVDDEAGFAAPFGLTFPERRAKGFVISRTGHECQWNGPSWPFATSIALTGLANHLHAIGENDPDFIRRRASFCRLLHQYAAAQTRKLEDGRLVPWIDEDMDPFTGEWLARALLIEQRKGKKGYVPERGKDYNHSTFCDIVVTGLCGFMPREDGKMEVKPLAPPEWDWWCLDGVRYQGRDVTILYDKYGTRYGRGAGLVMLPAET